MDTFSLEVDVEKWIEDADGIILVFDLTYKTSFKKLEEYLKIINRKFSLIPMIVIGNKSDMNNSIEIQKEEVFEMFKYSKKYFDYFECSAKNGTNLHTAFQTIAKFTIEREKEFFLPETLDYILKTPIKGVHVKDRSYRFKTYPLCFIASGKFKNKKELVDWLVKYKNIGDRKKALNLALELHKSQIFKHVAGRNDFVDDFLFYEFAKGPKVVIIGGGFAGKKVARLLENDFNVHLIAKTPFENLPSLPILVTNPSHLENMTAFHSDVIF
jgi:hypothetical protein